MDVKEVSAEAAIRPECWDEFQRLSHVVWDQLTYLRTTSYLLGEVLNFPIWTLAWDKQIFLRVVTRSFYESVILTITRIVTDKSEGVLTLLAFRNHVVDMLVPEAVDGFKRRLKDTKFDAATRDLADRVRTLRKVI